MLAKVKSRIIKLSLSFAIIAAGIIIFLFAIEDNIVFFLPPSKIDESKIGQKIRVGGIVVPGSIEKKGASETNFILTDHKNTIHVSYDGFLPALFRENQGIVVDGVLKPGRNMIAYKLLAKHDEYYYPPGKDSSVKTKSPTCPEQN